MKNLQEKVKDIVELRSFKRLTDFAADPVKTLSNYHFTDVTSDLMSKWIDRIVNLQGQKAPAFALAGYRGVGKSHFLAVLGAMMSNPELRSRITDPHVLTSAQRLRRRQYPVAYVRRGLRATLRDELIDAMAVSLQTEAKELDLPLPELLGLASDMAGDVPFVLIIDTASERLTRVAREDGEFLSEIAQAAENLNVFLGIALDDDIADADGINSAISRTYTIDYLDQEHLYKVVEGHIFPKRPQMQAVLHSVYEQLRALLPTFRWSEQRFNALYPMHPVILEVAPIVRFYVHDFALLGFAAEAGAKILGRPADSLIGLDEVFDLVDKSLRSVDDLKEAFAAYDKLNSEIVAKLPVMQRLQAKLILKALMLLSMDGSGKTAGEISAAMLISDEKKPEKAQDDIAELIEKFIAAMPDAIEGKDDNSGEKRYGFKLKNKDGLNAALASAAAAAPADAVPKMLRRMMKERFSDCTFPDEGETERSDWMDCQSIWRGSVRRGRLIWDSGRFEPADGASVSAEMYDWQVEIVFGRNAAGHADTGDVPRALWKPDDLRPEEADTILRYHELLTNASLREKFGDQTRTAAHSHMVAVEKIWNRSFLLDAKLSIVGLEAAFPEEISGSDKLAEIFGVMLAPLFDSLYPEHPVFAQTLGMNEVSALATDLFSGGGQSSAELQALAETFALPLGLVTRRGEVYLPEYEEVLASLPTVAEVLHMVDESADGSIQLQAIYKRLKQPPFGLSREAQQLILTALVSRRQIEFVTSKGDRINRRSLDLKIIWGDIVAVARPASMANTGETLTHWAETLTGRQSFVKKGKDAGDDVREALQEWLNDWKRRRIPERFNQLPDEILTTRVWRLSMHAMASFGVVAYAVNAILENTMPMDEGLHRIGDAFSHSKDEFARRSADLVKIEDFIDGAARREEIRSYLSVCEVTRDADVEKMREELTSAVSASYLNPNKEDNIRVEQLWSNFRGAFSEYFAVRHEMVMKSHSVQQKFDEIMKSDGWWQFENLSKIGIFQLDYWRRASRIRREFQHMDCRFEIREMLQIHPFCACSFTLARTEHWEKLPDALTEAIGRGLASYKHALSAMRDVAVPLLEDAKRRIDDDDARAAAKNLIDSLQSGVYTETFTHGELRLLQKIFEGSDNGSAVKFSSNALNILGDEHEDFSRLVAEMVEDVLPLNG